MTIRERQQEIEKQTLGCFAAISAESRGRERAEPECDIRTVFCRDRDRILHSKAFRRLKQKTQVFLSPEGDHYRTRLTHTLEVSQIARTLARAMRVNEDLTEAVALGHDLGHTPFGHAGEKALNEIAPFGFKHFEQSARVVRMIEKNHKGLNLTYETVDGILNHTSGEWAVTLEGRIVRFADRIAFLNHDIEDAISAGVLREESIPGEITGVLGSGKSKRITTLINSLMENTDGDKLSFSDEVQTAYDKLYDFMFENIYLNSASDVKSEEYKVLELIAMLYEHYVNNPEKLPEFYRHTAESESVQRAVTDYISGMSDAYAIYCFESLFIPKPWGFR